MLQRGDMFPFQGRAVERIKLARDLPRLALLIEPGYGKTVIALTALADLDAWPALVVAPARVAKQVWPAEAARWDHLRNVSVQSIGQLREAGEDGKLRRRKHVPSLDADAHVETISYENLPWLLDRIDLESRYRAVVFDELERMKTPGAVRFKRMRGRSMDIPIRLGLTGTPVGNHLLDLWGEMFMVAADKPLGPNFSGFRDRYFQSMDYMQNQWELKHHPSCARWGDLTKACNCAWAHELEREIHERVKPYSYVLPPQPEVKVPRWYPNLIELDLPAKVEQQAAELQTQLWTMLDSGVELEALSQSTVAIKLQQLASGAVYTGPDRSSFETVHERKLEALEDLLDELQGEPAVVFYWFDHEHTRIKKRLERRGCTWATDATPGNIEKFARRELEVLLLHPASAGHGVDGLQAGGHHAIWMGPPWSWSVLDQGNRRLARIGQKAPAVTGHIFCCGSTDARVYSTVCRKADTERRLFASLETG